MSRTPLTVPLEAVRRLWRERRWYGRRRDWLARWYNGLINRTRGLPWPGRGGVWPVRVAGVEEPFYVRQGSKDWVALREVWMQGEYEVIRSWPLDGIATVLDLGANIGLTVRLWRRRFPEARVIAVEPDASNIALARRNVAAFGGETEVQWIEAAVAERPGRLYLDRSSGNALVYRVVPRPTSATAEVEALTVDQILDRTAPDTPIDLLKCDIEGSEREVFSHCRSWIGRVRRLVIETHPSYSVASLLDDLRKGGVSPRILWQRTKEPGVALVFLDLSP